MPPATLSWATRASPTGIDEGRAQGALLQQVLAPTHARPAPHLKDAEAGRRAGRRPTTRPKAKLSGPLNGQGPHQCTASVVGGEVRLAAQSHAAICSALESARTSERLDRPSGLALPGNSLAAVGHKGTRGPRATRSHVRYDVAAQGVRDLNHRAQGRARLVLE